MIRNMTPRTTIPPNEIPGSGRTRSPRRSARLNTGELHSRIRRNHRRRLGS